jgi:3alpha(or 20beta)-hydroxysteroid dehydrogenase
MSELEGRVALVTGAARGVGAQIAERFVRAGARVILADVLQDEGRATAARLGASTSFEPLDVTSEGDWMRVVAATVDAHERIDVLVNNAAVLHIGSLESTTAESFRRVYEVNTLGPFLGTRAVLAGMKAQQSGSIVHVCSVDGLIGMNGVAAYASSKWGLRGLAKSSALELGRDGIRVNTVCPAGGNQEMYGPWFEKLGGLREETEAYSSNRAIPGSTPIDAIANAVLYLASDASGNVTGIDLPVDGGTVAGRYLPGFDAL